MTDGATRCRCAWCGGDRPHTPQAKGGCTGCWCDHRAAQKTHRVRLKVATIPKPYKDVDELLRTAGGSAFERMIAEAQQAPAWMIDNIDSHGYDLTTIEGKQDVADAMLDTFLSLPAIERGGYIRRLSERMEIPERELRAALNEQYVLRGRPNVRRDDESVDVPNPEPEVSSLAESLGLE